MVGTGNASEDLLDNGTFWLWDGSTYQLIELAQAMAAGEELPELRRRVEHLEKLVRRLVDTHPTANRGYS